MKTLLSACLAAALATTAGLAHADAKQDVIDAFGKAMATGKFISRIDDEHGKQMVEMRAILPNRYHMKTPETEMIILPNGTWMNANGQWMQFPMNMSKMIEGYSKQGIEQGMQSMVEVHEIGSDTVDGCDSTVYAYRTQGKFMGVDNDSNAEVAVCEDTGMPIRVISRDKKDRVQATIHYDWGGDFDITAP